MRILVAGIDRTENLGREVERAAMTRPVPSALRSVLTEHSALSLGQCASTSEYQERLLRLLRLHQGISADLFDIPRRPGWKGACSSWLKKILWKILRYQHERMAHQQSVVNELLVSALEFERDQHKRDLRELEQRLANGGRPAP